MLPKELDALSPVSRAFFIHGVWVRVASNTSVILEPISEMLSYFSADREVRDGAVRLYFLKESPAKLPHLEDIRREGRVIFDSERDPESFIAREMGLSLRHIFWEGLYLADFGAMGAMLLDLPRGLGASFIPEPESLNRGMISNLIFLVGLSEMLRARGLFLIHSAALAWRGRGLIAPGLTGSGKTTLSLALLRGGFKYLSDDRPFIREKPGGFELLAFPEVLDVTEETIANFPEVSSLPDGAFTRGLRKRRFRVEELYPGSIVDSCTPRVLVALNIVDEERSRLMPISKIEAAHSLLPQSLVVTDEGTAERQFHLLCELVESLDCYRLDFARDFLDVHKLIKEIM
jgi:hypothetical protein